MNSDDSKTLILQLQEELEEAREIIRSMEEESRAAKVINRAARLKGSELQAADYVEALRDRIKDLETVRDAYRHSWRSAQATIERMEADLKAFKEEVPS